MLCVGYLGEQIENVYRRWPALRLEVMYSFDGEVLMGTGGALRRACRCSARSFLCSMATAILTLRWRRSCSHSVANRPALMTVFRNEGHWDTSNVSFDGARVVAMINVLRVRT